MKITDDHFYQLLEDGYIILPRYIPEEDRVPLAAAQRRVLKPWDEIKDNPPKDRSALVPYPHGDATMARPYMKPELLNLARRFLKTPDVYMRVGYMVARYPGFVSGDAGHIDNGNNSLLPISDTAREYSQLCYWMHLEEVTADQAPLLLVKKKYGKDLSKAEPLVCPAGTVCIFTTATFHASSTFKGTTGQRFTWGMLIGRADHSFEGLLHYTSMAGDPVFKQVVAGMTAQERTLFRFPPPFDAYYTRQTLAALEQLYPGWNARGEYQAVD